MKSVKLNLNSFKIIEKYNLEFHTKIHKALFIKKRNPGLNRQLYANDSSFLLNFFYKFRSKIKVIYKKRSLFKIGNT